MAEGKVFNDSEEFSPMPTPDQVVREGEAGRLDPIPFQFNDIRALAQKILKRAQEQGQQKLAAARNQIAAMEKEAADKAYKEAFPKGEKDGFAKGEKEGKALADQKMQEELEKERQALRENAKPAVEVLQQIATIMNENRQALVAQAEGDLLLLALDIAKRLVGRELNLDPEAIKPLASEAIGLVTDRSGVTVRVNPEDYKVMEDAVPDLKAIFPDLGAVTIEADESIQRGGLTAATREAEVDMRLATRLKAFEEAILGFSGEEAVAPWSKVDPEDVVFPETGSNTGVAPPPQEVPKVDFGQHAEHIEPEPKPEPESEPEPQPEPPATEHAEVDSSPAPDGDSLPQGEPPPEQLSQEQQPSQEDFAGLLEDFTHEPPKPEGQA